MDVEPHIGLARSIASKFYENYCGLIDYEDIEQESFYLLIKASEGYDIDHGAKFSSYATTIIKRGLQRFLARNESPISYGVCNNFDGLYRKVLATSDMYKINANDIMMKYKTSQYNANSILKKYRNKSILRLDKCLENSTDTSMDILDLGGYKRPDLMYERKDLLECLYIVLKTMPMDWKIVINKRFFEDWTLQKIAEYDGITAQAVKGKLDRIIKNLKIRMGE